MSESLPIALYTAEQVREMDQVAIEKLGLSGIKLMKRAGRAVFDTISKYWPDAPITVFCGGGNNGGDGYIVAALAAENNVPVLLVQLSAADKLKGDAKMAYDYALLAGVAMVPFSDAMEIPVGVVVDALLGTGLVLSAKKGEQGISKPFAQAIRCINQSGLPVVAVDIPSGLCSNTGTASSRVVQAEITVSFIGLKRGMLTRRGPDVCGDVIFSSLAIPSDVFTQIKPSAVRLQREELMTELPVRQRDAHKGNFGHVMVIGGDHGYGGAVAMAAEAALRAGAGLVSVVTQPQHVSAILSRRPELMVRGVVSGQELVPLINGVLLAPTVLVVGPGLGRSPWSEQLLQQVLLSDLPMVLDADALNILSENCLSVKNSQHWVLTPHPGEAARLLGITIEDVECDRFAAVTALQQKFHCPVLLKGAGSLSCISSDEPIGLCSSGSPAMASGGMGDVLSGIVGGLIAQKMRADAALLLGICIHADAADIAAQGDDRGLLATDLFEPLRRLVNDRINQ